MKKEIAKCNLKTLKVPTGPTIGAGYSTYPQCRFRAWETFINEPTCNCDEPCEYKGQMRVTVIMEKL